MFGGSVNYERLILSEESCWTGGPQEYASYWGGNVPRDQASQKQEAFARMQQTLAEKRILKPTMPFVKDVMGDEEGFGRQVEFGEITVEEVNLRESVRDYRRELDLEKGVARVSYFVDKTLYSREQFCSYPDAVCILRIQSSTPGSINIRVSLSTPHSTSAEYSNIHNRLGFKSHLDSNNLTIEAQVAVKTEGATGISLATSPQQIVLMGFDTVTLYYTFGTGWSANTFPEFANLDPHERLTGVLDKVVTGWYGDLVDKHLKDYGGLFSRFRLEFGVDQNDQGTSVGKNTLTTDQLVVKSHTGILPSSEEAHLETLLVQYSRYLLIASSRPGALPLTGNGIWASDDNIAATLSSRYGMNIGLQMQYWMAEMTDLGETVTPLIDYMEQLLQPRGQDTASILYNARGWTTQPFSNIWAHTGPLSDATAKDLFYFPAAAAWLCQHLWDRYLYSQDDKFLKDRAYKLMKGASLFWMDTLVKERGNGSLLSSPSQSPGHGPFTEGSALDQQLVFQLWDRTLEAVVSGPVNEKDKEFVQELTSKLATLSRGLKVGSWGQLQEWNLDLDDPHDRPAHLGPLYAVYPGDQIYLQQQDALQVVSREGEVPTMRELVEAARVSLRRLSAGSVSGEGKEFEQGWSRAWRAVTWARLNDGHQATRELDTFKRQNLVSSNLVPLSLKDLSGHVGYGAAVIEMLVQSPRPGNVNVLTCFEGLPDRWAKQGKVAGYRTRDGHIVTVEWKDRRVRSVELAAVLRKGAVNLRIATLMSGEGEGEGGRREVEMITVVMKGSKKPVQFVKDGDVLRLTVAKGSTYVVQIDLLEP
ncbi:hypothetical protein BGZ96_007581 [Linnemannia gamsii]|uniref:Glycosyl hydrolase family 95 N-terminal domain-containing protein n=1 Tax=Linnemannia gamsii TaxID=64522 RepID=A0ABQ7K0Q9_9FUNG|nr:hypothetical protein BGZ96_007581 [Linnemannia gamsii]